MQEVSDESRILFQPGQAGPVVAETDKTRVTIRIENDVLEWFRRAPQHLRWVEKNLSGIGHDPLLGVTRPRLRFCPLRMLKSQNLAYTIVPHFIF